MQQRYRWIMTKVERARQCSIDEVQRAIQIAKETASAEMSITPESLRVRVGDEAFFPVWACGVKGVWLRRCLSTQEA